MNNDAMIEYWNGAAGQKWVDQSDRLDAMLGQFADGVLDAAAIQTGERALDIGCGAGVLTLGATAQSGGSIGSLGVDVSTPLLALARKRAAEAESPATFEHGDASVYTADDKLDLMISRFGVMFFDDPAAAFANIRAQIRTGGRMAFMCWQALPLNDWAFAPFQAALPLLREAPPSPDPTAPGPFAFADKDRVAGILTEAGWQNSSIEPFETEITLPGDDVETSARFMLQLGPLSRLIAEQDLDPQTILNAVIDKLSEHAETDGRIKMKSACWLVQANA
ncbi:MAG: class I SAM-dependent methyltransferase [Hyphomonas sp.]|nr:class I SAM-dependent methyltransferase [Hyphomonas sp.]